MSWTLRWRGRSYQLVVGEDAGKTRQKKKVLWGSIVEGVRFVDFRIGSLHFADDVVLLASPSRDLQLLLDSRMWSGRDENQHLQIRGHDSQREKGGMPSPGQGGDLVPSGGFKYLRVTFMGERKIDRSAYQSPLYRGEEGAEPKGKALDLSIDLHSYPQLWSRALCSDQKNEIKRLKWASSVGWRGSPLEIGWEALPSGRSS